MKKVIVLIALLLINIGGFAQTTTINSTPVISANGVSGPLIFNNNESTKRVITEYRWQMNTYQNDFLRISNAKGTSGTPQGFVPMIHGNSATGSGLVLLANTPTPNDNVGGSALMSFIARKNFIQEGYDNAGVGLPISNRPLFQWINGGNPQMTMISNGNLGVNSVTPESKLHVVGDIRITKSDKIIFGQGNDGFGEWLQNSNSVSSGSSGTHGLSIFANSKERMRITNLGMIGIGVSNPTATFHVVASPTQTAAPSFIRFEKLPQSNCGYLLMIDDNGYVYRSRRKGNPCVDTGTCSPSPAPSALEEVDIFQKYEDLSKKYDRLTKEVEELKSKNK